ncbi:hypothetical protein B0H14DRAFT_3144140 [Mycena olivaceomarginata]|nr:hypothetical protein B0H14DRAFT_3144140 [Mycena olivaceomarginata]
MNPPNSEHTPTVAVLEDDPETDQTEDEGQGEDEGASTDEEDLLVDEEETERNDDGRRVASRTITSQIQAPAMMNVSGDEGAEPETTDDVIEIADTDEEELIEAHRRLAETEGLIDLTDV